MTIFLKDAYICINCDAIIDVTNGRLACSRCGSIHMWPLTKFLKSNEMLFVKAIAQKEEANDLKTNNPNHP